MVCQVGVPELRGLAMARLTGPDIRSIGIRPFVSSSTNEAPASMSTPATARCPKCNALCRLLHPDSPSYPSEEKNSDLDQNIHLLFERIPAELRNSTQTMKKDRKITNALQNPSTYPSVWIRTSCEQASNNRYMVSPDCDVQSSRP